MSRPKKAQVYSLTDGEQDVHAIVRYSGDPDEFTALAHHWLATKFDGYLDYPFAVAPPEPRWFRHNAYNGDDYGWQLGFPTGPGRGNWFGSYLKVVKIGCAECQYLHGAHHPDGCINAGITGLQTCMLTPPGGPHGLGEAVRRRAKAMIHLVRMRATGTPGPTLCDLDRFAPGVSFEMGGGYTWEGMDLRACYMCTRAARRDFAGLKVETSMREFAQLFVNADLPVGDGWAGLAPAPGTSGAWALAAG